MPSKNTISKAEFARRAGVTRTAVTNACKTKLKPALIGDRIDIDHESALGYLARKVIAKTPQGPNDGSKQADTKDLPIGEKKKNNLENEAAYLFSKDEGYSEEDVQKFLAMPLREIILRFGTQEKFKDFITARRTIEDIKTKELKNAETENKLIPRELVSTHILGYIDGNNTQALIDVARTISKRTVALVKSGEPIESIEALTRELLSKHFKNVKSTAVRLLERKVI